MKKIKELFIKYEEIIRYLIIGGLTTLISLVSYFLVTTLFLDPEKELELQIANIISWIISVTFAYFTNHFFVFKKKENVSFKEALKFYSSRISTLLIEMLLMYLLVSVCEFNDRIIKIIVQIIIIVLNYVFSKIFVFKNKNEKLSK